jgi:hypothetical protein
VRWEWDGLVVASERQLAVEPFEAWLRRDAAGRRLNGYLAIGIAARCASLLGPSPLDDAVASARADLDQANPSTVVAARSAASLLTVRCASAVVAAGGGRSVEAGEAAARLMREAMFLLVFGQTRDIRAAQLAALGAPAPRV